MRPYENSSTNFGGIFDVDTKITAIAELAKRTESPDFWNDQQEAQKVNKSLNVLRGIVTSWQAPDGQAEEAHAILELIADSPDPDFEQEANDKLDAVASLCERLEFSRMLSGPHDRNDAILSINAGAGGTEACDWAEILLRMYRRWAEARGFATEVVDFTSGDGAGFRSVTLTVTGAYAYGYLSAEVGVHRLVRISPFDANKRRHTSFCSILVLPDIEDDVVIEISDADLRVDTFRSSGAGGQHVNKTDSAVRLTHIPSGFVVACQNQRSQHQNRATAMKLLKAKLFEVEMEKKRKAREALGGEKSEIGWGSQIRSYVLQPYQLVKDHRTHFEVGNIGAVLDGDLDGLMRAFLLRGRK